MEALVNNALIQKRPTSIKSRGGKRPRAGRKKGSLNKITAAIRAKAMESGTMPLEALLHIMYELLEAADLMTDEQYIHVNAKVIGRLELLERAADIAAKAAPYMHPKLQSIEHGGMGDRPMDTHMTVEFVTAAVRD
jgi:hypothetical protein